MKKQSLTVVIMIVSVMFLFSQCDQHKTETAAPTTDKPDYGGFESQVKWGEHLVTIGGCNDCHTPKKMTPMGPVLDISLTLSGHPAGMPPPDVDRKAMEAKGYAVTQTLTAWVGPWGISYAANLTSDATGIGNWTEENMITALRQGKSKGLPDARSLLPPMPWEYFKSMSDGEIKAIFAYLKSTKPVKNIVPEPAMPVSPPPPAAK